MTTAKNKYHDGENNDIPKQLLRVLEEFCVGGFFLTYFSPEGEARTLMKCDNELYFIGLAIRSKMVAAKMEAADFGGISGGDIDR
jgi:hypothetical protein